MDSLLGQTYRNLEIICVNDGSTDGSAVILEAYAAKDTRIKVIHQENAGVSVARNRGLDAATGAFVSFVDADDWVEPWGYERVLGCFDPEIDIVCFGTCVDGEISDAERGELEWFLTLPLVGAVQVSELACKAVNGCIWNKVWRRNAIEKIGARFVEGLRYSEDECFFYSTLGGVKRICCLPDKVYHYVQHSCSTMRTSSQLRYRALDSLEGVGHMLEFYKKLGVYPRMKDIFLVRFNQCFECAEKYATSDMKSKVQQMEYGVLCSGNLKSHREKYFVRAILNRQMGRIARLFCHYVENRLVLGIGRLRLASVTFEEDKTTWRVLGTPFLVRQRGVQK